MRQDDTLTGGTADLVARSEPTGLDGDDGCGWARAGGALLPPGVTVGLVGFQT
jgi:hypothetical protein